MFDINTLVELDTYLSKRVLQMLISARTINSTLKVRNSDLDGRTSFAERGIKKLKKLYGISKSDATLIYEVMIEIVINDDIKLMDGIGGSKPRSLWTILQPLKELNNVFWPRKNN